MAAHAYRAARGGDADPFGNMPAPLRNPAAWPPNYADGFNTAVGFMEEAFPSVLERLATRPAPGAEVRKAPAEPHHVLESPNFLRTSGDVNAIPDDRRYTIVAPAPAILRSAAQAIDDRAALRDCPGGERSMARCVAAFNAITGHHLSETEGWHFMSILKLARATAGGHHLDDHTDHAAYAALAGEAAERAARA